MKLNWKKKDKRTLVSTDLKYMIHHGRRDGEWECVGYAFEKSVFSLQHAKELCNRSAEIRTNWVWDQPRLFIIRSDGAFIVQADQKEFGKWNIHPAYQKSQAGRAKLFPRNEIIESSNDLDHLLEMFSPALAPASVAADLYKITPSS